MNNIKKIYQHAGKCDDQQDLKDILDAAMVSTPEVFKNLCSKEGMLLNDWSIPIVFT